MNHLPASAKEGFLGADIALDTDAIRLVALDSSYVFSAAHNFLDDVAAGARVATSANFTNKSVAGGVFDADNVTLDDVAEGDTITQIWVYQWTGSDATSRLVAYFDTRHDDTPISVDTNGGDVTVSWSNGASRIFVL